MFTTFLRNVTIELMKRETLKLAERVHRIFKDRRLTLAVAESCTGGLLSNYLTTMPGASIFFKAGIVSYSEDAKKDIIGISPDIISSSGVISWEIALEMAEKVRMLSKTDYSISNTGNLGPDVLEGKDLGLVYIALSTEGKSLTEELRLKGSRDENREKVSLSALRFLIEFVEGK